MRFNPSGKGNEDLLPDGEFDFEVIDAVDRTSSAGNDMMVLKLRAGSNGSSKVIIDYIVANNIRKVRSVSKACGLIELFETGEIVADAFVGRSGRMKVTTERSANNRYPDRNVVLRYIGKK